MYPISDPAHESQTRTDPDDGEEQIEPVQKTSVLINISFCLGVGLMLVYAGLDAHQALASAGHGWDIVSIFTIAVPRLLSGTIWVELIILCFLAVMCTGSRGARQTLMLYAAVCCLSGMLITAGSFDLAGFFFPAFTALNPATSPATASLTVTKVLVIIVGVGAALFIFLLGLVSTRDEDVVLSEEPPAPAAEGAKNVAGADEEEGMTIEERQAAHYLEMLRLIDEEERVTRTPAEQRILDLRAKMAVTENPLEKQRLEGEILLTLRAERAGLEPYDGELDGDEPVDDESVDDEPVDDELVDDEPVDEENVLSHQKRVLAWKKHTHIGKKRKPTDGLKRPLLSSTRRPAARLTGRSLARNSAATRTPRCTPRKGTASTSGASRPPSGHPSRLFGSPVAGWRT